MAQITVVPDAARDVGEQRAERERVGAVEPGGRLVRDDRQRPRGERARDRGPLALARGELGNRPLGVLGQADRSERLLRRPRPGEPRSSSAELGVLPRAEERDEPERLTDERDRAAPQLGSSGAVEPCERDPVDEHVSLVRHLQPREQVQQRRLPGARRPGDDGELPGRKRRVEPLERRRRPVPLRQPARLDGLCSCNTSSLGTAWLSGREGRLCYRNTKSLVRGLDDQGLVAQVCGCVAVDPGRAQELLREPQPAAAADDDRAVGAARDALVADRGRRGRGRPGRPAPPTPGRG